MRVFWRQEKNHSQLIHTETSCCSVAFIQHLDGLNNFHIFHKSQYKVSLLIAQIEYKATITKNRERYEKKTWVMLT